MLSLFGACEYIALDTETSTSPHKDDDADIRDGSGFATGISISGRLPALGILSDYFPLRHTITGGEFGYNLSDGALAKLKKVIESYQGYLIFHNAKFDLVSLQTLGINYTGKFYCTLELCHLLDEERPFAKSLDACAAHYLKGVDDKKDKSTELATYIKLYGWKAVPPTLMSKYAATDSELTLRLFEKILPMVDKDLKAYWHEQKMPFYEVIIAMERRGVKIDTDLCKRMIVHGEMTMDEIVEILQLNPGSPKDLKKLLIDELGLPVVKVSPKTGNPSFDKAAMATYETMLDRLDDPTAQYLLAYRGWQKSVSSNYKAYLDLLSPDGRLRPNYKLHGTKTGRMSCEKPNLQQIPRASTKAWNGVLKQAFLPKKGYKLWEADYGQLELRLATAYAGEQGLMAVFNEDRDVFSEMAVELGMARHDAKTLTYTIQYGGGVNRLSTVFGVSTARAQSIRQGFFDTYPRFHAISKLASQRVRSKGKVQLWTKRYRHFRYPSDEAHKAFNSVIQGGAADFVERAMIRLYKNVDDDTECRMLLQVHDSVVFEIKEGMEEKYHPLIIEQMATPDVDFGVKFAVDLHEWGT